GTEGAAGENADVLELAVFLVLVKQAGAGIVGDVNVSPAIVVEVRRQNTQSVGAIGLGDARGLGNVGERAIAIIVVEDVLASVQTWRPAGHHDAFVETGP